MSIIIKGSNFKSSNSKYIPCGKVTNVNHRNADTKCYITWNDGEDLIIDGTRISSWNNTVLVRKENSMPNSISDGSVILKNTIKDKYKNEYFIDSGLSQNTYYYYRFFTIDNNKICNNALVGFKIYTSDKLANADPVLENNSWGTINAVSSAGLARYIWKIGDEKKIHMESGYNGYADVEDAYYTMQIWDFDHYDKVDGSGKAGICFGTKDTTTWYCKYDDSTCYGYSHSDLFSMLNSYTNIYGSGKMLKSNDELLDSIKPVIINASEYENNKFILSTTESSIFAPCIEELGFQLNSGSYVRNLGTKFPIFTDGWSRWKFKANTADSDRILGKNGSNYWVRDLNSTYRGDSIYNYLNTAVKTPGEISGCDLTSSNYVVFIFNV